MEFRLKKWIDNALNLSFKLIFDEDIDLLEKYLKELNAANKAVNSRVDNLVLNSGGDSPNEVVDARTNLGGRIYDTLESRLNNDSSEVASKFEQTNERLDAVEVSNAEIEQTLKELYGEATQNLSINVSKAKGNDETGDGSYNNPYQTIQKAANSIPKIVSGIDIEIICEPDSYDEDVVIEAIYGAKYVTVRGSNSGVVDALTTDTGFSFRSIIFSSIAGQCVVEGLTQSSNITTNENIIYFLRVGYGSVSNCRFATSLKSTEKRTIYYNQSDGGVAHNYFKDQNVILRSEFNSCPIFYASNVTAGTSNVGVSVYMSDLRLSNSAPIIKATTPQKIEDGGQII
ncbi:hypothetical protein [Listeria seeligeri]|uniref:hypothetical protein n=1 Tax=Listeria seeligeri TaxID=1640 RepID=UPI0018892F35|nr:hypothetical protein [Listeria seeligeri]MBF2653970.1 hypothetical protein [Listeria seeligeri]